MHEAERQHTYDTHLVPSVAALTGRAREWFTDTRVRSTLSPAQGVPIRQTRSVDDDTWRPRYPFASEKSRQRDVDLTKQIHEALAAAEAAPDEKNRRRYLRSAQQFRRIRQYRRTFPSDVWWIGVVAVLVTLPWALLGRAGYPLIGVGCSALVGVVLWLIRSSRRRPTT